MFLDTINCAKGNRVMLAGVVKDRCSLPFELFRAERRHLQVLPVQLYLPCIENTAVGSLQRL